MTESRRVRDLDHDDDLSIEIQPLPRKEPITPTSLSSSPGHLPSWEDKTFPAPFWLVDQAVSPVNWCNLSCGREEQGEAGSIMLKNHNPGRILFASQDPLRPFRLAARTLGPQINAQDLKGFSCPVMQTYEGRVGSLPHPCVPCCFLFSTSTALTAGNAPAM